MHDAKDLQKSRAYVDVELAALTASDISATGGITAQQALDAKSALTNLAPAYSAESTYALGAYCTYGGVMYRCTTAIEAAEVWTVGHWTTEAAGTALSAHASQLAQIDACEAATTAANTATSTANAAEALRASAESGRVSAESARVSAETGRASAESARVTAEADRVTAEGARASAETARASAEGARVTAENSRVEAEAARVTAETERAALGFSVVDGKLCITYEE